jgi:hypothetical protein
MNQWRRMYWPVIAALCLGVCPAAWSQINSSRPDPGNRLNNPFRTQFKPAWNLTIQDPVKLMDVGPVTDAKRSNLILLVGGRSSTDTQRKLRVLHWNGSRFDTDGELVSQSIGIDTLLLGRFHPGAPAPTVVPAKTPGATVKPSKPRAAVSARALQVLTNTGIYVWSGSGLDPLFARQLPDVKQSIVLDNRPDLVVVGAGNGASSFEFTQSEMRPAANEKLQGGGYAHFGIGMQPYPGSDTLNLSSGIRFAQAIWAGRNKWLIGLVRGKPAGTPDDPGATTGDRLVVYTPKFPSRDKTFWETRMDDPEEAWTSDPLPGRVLDVRVGDPHNDGKTGILVLTSENDDRDRRVSFFAAFGNG